MTQSQTDILIRLAQKFTPARAINGNSSDEPSAEGERGEDEDEYEDEEGEGGRISLLRRKSVSDQGPVSKSHVIPGRHSFVSKKSHYLRRSKCTCGRAPIRSSSSPMPKSWSIRSVNLGAMLSRMPLWRVTSIPFTWKRDARSINFDGASPCSCTLIWFD